MYAQRQPAKVQYAGLIMQQTRLNSLRNRQSHTRTLDQIRIAEAKKNAFKGKKLIASKVAGGTTSGGVISPSSKHKENVSLLKEHSKRIKTAYGCRNLTRNSIQVALNTDTEYQRFL